MAIIKKAATAHVAMFVALFIFKMYDYNVSIICIRLLSSWLVQGLRPIPSNISSVLSF